MNFEKRGKGYIGKSMSVNAKEAYDREEMPLSKWKKSTIIAGIMNINDDLDEKLVKKLDVTTLKRYMLVSTVAHHTGAFFNRTEFYMLDEEYIIGLKNEDIQDLIDRRKQYLENTKEEREKEKEEKEKKRAIKRAEKEEKAKWEDLSYRLRKYTKFKTDRGFINAAKEERIDLESLEEKYLEEEKQREIKRYISFLGQTKKLFGYSSVQEMNRDLLDGTLSLEEVKKRAYESINYRYDGDEIYEI